jgi:hypothetical protein
MAEAQAQIGPNIQINFRCGGCTSLKTTYWKDHLDNDETDSGTSASCMSADNRDIGGAYAGDNPRTPDWCPVLLARAPEAPKPKCSLNTPGARVDQCDRCGRGPCVEKLANPLADVLSAAKRHRPRLRLSGDRRFMGRRCECRLGCSDPPVSGYSRSACRHRVREGAGMSDLSHAWKPRGYKQIDDVITLDGAGHGE